MQEHNAANLLRFWYVLIRRGFCPPWDVRPYDCTTYWMVHHFDSGRREVQEAIDNSNLLNQVSLFSDHWPPVCGVTPAPADRDGVLHKDLF